MDQSALFTVNDLSVKFKSKWDLINVLSREGNIYLPPKRDVTQKYLRSLLHGEKLYVKWSEVIIINVPQYEGLTVKDLMKFAETEFDIHKFLPEYDYHKDPNRSWLCNIINTIITEKFNKFIDKKIKERNKKLITSQNLTVNAKEEFIKIFKNSQAISTMKGKSYFLVRNPKQSKEKIMINKLNEEKKESIDNVSKLKKELEVLQNKMVDYHELQKEAELNNERLRKLFDSGIIDADGNFINNDMN